MNNRNLLITLLFFIAFQAFSQNAKKYTTYVVKYGETLKSIAKKVGCKTKEIKNLNPDVDKNNLSVNTTLVIPNKNFNKLIIKTSPKSEVKVMVHEVKAGETFYGIAKMYNVTIQSIKDANPTTTEGLKIGQKLRIPHENEFTLQPETGKVVFYKVKKGDTKWRIATLYDISIAELERINPNLQGELKENENIWVPASAFIPDEIKDSYLQKQDDLFIYHTVKQGEGLFRIAVLYDTSQKEIERLNPKASKKLRPGMLLKIPGKKTVNFQIHEVAKGDTFFSLTREYEVSKEDLLAINPELEDGLKQGMLLKIEPLVSIANVPGNLLLDSISFQNFGDRTIHLSFLMPLKATEKVDYNSKNSSQLRTICTDFYMGAEMAIDSLRKQGLLVEYHIYDTENDPMKIYELMKDDNLKDSDALIGPFFFENAQKAAKELRKTPIITPLFSKKQGFDSHNNLIKAAVDKKEKLTALKEYLKKSYTDQKIVIISDKHKANIAAANNLKQSLLQLDSISKISMIKPTHNKKKPKEIYMSKKELELAVDVNKGTWVILISDNNIVISDTVNTYGVMANDQDIQLFTTKTFDDLEHLDFNYLGQLNWSYPSVQFDNLNTASVSNFNKEFYQLNSEYPSSYAFTGFDLTYDTLIRLSASEDFSDGLEAGISQRLSHQFNYEKTEKGYFNKGVLMVSLNKDLEFNLLK